MIEPAPGMDAQDTVYTTKAALELEQQGFSQYLLYSRSEILFLLRAIIQKKCSLTAYVDSERSFFLTTLLTLSEDGNWLYLDISADPEINQRVLITKRLMFTTMLDRVKVQFSLSGLQQVNAGGHFAFAGRLPETILRLQRREHFRLSPPVTTPLQCTIDTIGTEGQKIRHEFVVLDISGGGLGLMIPENFATRIPVGTTLTGCTIDLTEEGVINTGLCIRNAFPINTKNGSKYIRAGCEYVELPGTSLTLVQRYITRVERARKARENSLQ